MQTTTLARIVRQKNSLLLLSSICYALLSSPLVAETTQPTSKWGVGISVNNHPGLYKNPDQDYRINIFPQYRGEQLNIDQESIAWRFNPDSSLYFEALGKLENRGYEAKDSAVLQGMKQRDASFDAGARIGWQTDYGVLSLDTVTDISGKHDGQSADLRFGPGFYTAYQSESRELSLGLLVGVKWESAKVVDYYYGVKDSEASASRAAYRGRAALTPYVGLKAQLALTSKISLETDVVYKQYPDEIADSPLMDDDHLEFRTGLTYRF